MSGAESKHDPLEDFEQRQLTFNGKTKRVFVAGKGPAVIVMSEMPGIYPLVARFARWVRDDGFTVWMPDLFGRAGAPITLTYGLGSMIGGCISRRMPRTCSRAFVATMRRGSRRTPRKSPVVRSASAAARAGSSLPMRTAT